MADSPDDYLAIREFARRRDGMIHAMDGGLWLHRHVWQGRRLVHLVSTDRDRLLALGRRLGLAVDRLQFKPLKDPRTTERRDAWHWDLPERLADRAAAASSDGSAVNGQSPDEFSCADVTGVRSSAPVQPRRTGVCVRHLNPID